MLFIKRSGIQHIKSFTLAAESCDIVFVIFLKIIFVLVILNKLLSLSSH